GKIKGGIKNVIDRDKISFRRALAEIRNHGKNFKFCKRIQKKMLCCSTALPVSVRKDLNTQLENEKHTSDIVPDLSQVIRILEKERFVDIG
ncbi:MAG: hypothetical protein HLX43_01000, partial [Bacillus sp. (in: Bacteria)]|nr:hypothetical protein [Bacillus sp. (in: firmicutes)]